MKPTIHGINYSVFSGFFCHQLPWQPHLDAYYPRGHGLFTNILSLLGNGRLLFRSQILAVNGGRIILRNNNNSLPTCKFYLHRNISKSPILYWITHVLLPVSCDCDASLSFYLTYTIDCNSLKPTCNPCLWFFEGTRLPGSKDLGRAFLAASFVICIEYLLLFS